MVDLKFRPMAASCLIALLAFTAWSDVTTGLRGDMVQRYYEKEYRKAYAARQERFSRIKTKEDALRYQQEVQAKIRRSFGKLPEKTPLNARVTGQVDTGKLLIDKVIFESRPGVEVTGLFYRRKDSSGKIPGVLALCGHSSAGKQQPRYQELAQSLALRGYGVFIIDPMGQGERLLFSEEEKVTPGVMTHNMLGRQLALTGEFFGTWRLWDAIRGLDYLLSRPEIDPAHVGVTGTSGGGTMTTFLNVFDTRLTMAAPSCYITTQLRNLLNELPTDSEQVPPLFTAQGCEIADLLIASAPRPVILLAQDNDFFDPRGTEEAFAEVRRIYELLGKVENIEIFHGKGNHGYYPEHRVAAGKFFNCVSGLKDNGPESPDIKILPAEKLNCTRSGRVNHLGVYNLMQKFAAAPAADKRPVPEKVADILRLDKVAVPAYRVARTQYAIPGEKFRLNRFLLETEPGILVTLKQSSQKLIFRLVPPESIVLYIPHLSAADELADMDLPADGTVFALEVRGQGESQAAACNFDPEPHSVFHYYGSDFLHASCGNTLDRPYMGRRVQDVLNTAALLKKHGVKNIHLAGRGQGAVIAALAAVLLPEVNEVTLYNAPLSWREMAAGRVTKWPLSSMLYGVLRSTDLPEIYQHLRAKNIRIIEPWDNLMKPYTQELPDKTARKYNIIDLINK